MSTREPTYSLPFQHHIIRQFSRKAASKRDPYKTLFSIPEVPCRVATHQDGPHGLQRSQTLPPSAIRRGATPIDRGPPAKASKDDSSVGKSLFKSGTKLQRFDSLRRKSKSKIVPSVTDGAHCPDSFLETSIYVTGKPCSLSTPVYSTIKETISNVSLREQPSRYCNGTKQNIYEMMKYSKVPGKCIPDSSTGRRGADAVLRSMGNPVVEPSNCHLQKGHGPSYALPFEAKSDSDGGYPSAKRLSLSSACSDGSRLTSGTSTDEGIGMYSDTSSSIWSSTTSSSGLSDCKGMYDESASSCSGHSFGSRSSYSSMMTAEKGAVPKRRWGSFRRPDTKNCVCDADDDISSLKRGGSMRVRGQQLPVTSTLLRLLQLGLEQVGGGSGSTCASSISDDSAISNGVSEVTRREKLHPPRTDAHRLSRANLEESGDLELDAILNELCALEGKLAVEIGSKPAAACSNGDSSAATSIIPSAPQAGGVAKMQAYPVQRPPLPVPGGVKKFESMNGDSETTTASIARTDSPDNDSAFSDNVSMLSSESSASSGASGGGGVSSRNDTNRQKNMMDHAALVKAEKIKMALEKLKEANVKKLFIKAFSADGSTKSLLVDEKMSVGHVTRLLADKNHVRIDPKWAIVEQLPDLYMERIYEDDEMLVDNLLLWTRDSPNKLLFVERTFKFDFFIQPEKYLLSGQKSVDIEDETRSSLIEECMTNGRIPEVEGPLFLKSEGKKAWKKFYFVLRKSGLYYCPKGKNSKSSRDLICLAKFDSSQVYQGFNWKKKYKAPTDFGFALKHPHLQTKNAKLIKYLCTEDENSLSQWIMAMRVAKCGHKMADNYRSLVEDIAQEDIDMLASSRSFSLASVSGSSRGTSQATTPSSESRSLDSCLTASVGDDDDDSSAESSQDTPVNTLSRMPVWRQESIRSSASSSSSSGCLSERSSTGTPSGEHGFEAEFPQGTIKRKPSGNPKLPLTSTTRHLVKEVEDDAASRSSTLRRPKKSLSEEVNTLRRRNSANTSKTSLVSVVPSICTDDKVLPPKTLKVIPSATTEEYIEPSADFLPPPPPELLASTLSLNSLPPPPEESSLQSFPDEMSASMISLPPPPPPTMLSKPSSPPPSLLPKPMSPPPYILARPFSPTSNALPKPLSQPPTILPKPLSPPKSLSPPLPSPPPTPPKPVLLQPLPPPAVAPKPIRKVSFDSIVQTRTEEADFPPPPLLNNIYENSVRPPTSLAVQKSPQKKKKISFVDDVEILPPSPTSPVKPPLPRRSDMTRLSVPGKLDSPGCKVTPPRSFLNNLQKVMQKKWQVAQKCRDFDKMPHEVLGFRDPVPQSETEKNVGAWIQEHYGCLYENLSPNPPQASTMNPAQTSPPGGPPSSQVPLNYFPATANGAPPNKIAPPKRKPPPPPPKRADSTQLSNR